MEKITKLKNIFVILLLLISMTFAKNKLLIIRTAGPNFEEAKSGMVYDLQYDFDIVDYIIDKSTTVEDISNKMSTISPDVVALMNNRSISLYKKYQSTLKEGDKIVPSVSLMGILVKSMISGLKNSYGVEYEIPIVTSAVDLRTIMGDKKPIKSIGIVHRSNLNEFIKTNKAYCEQEGIKLVTIEIEKDKIDSDLKKELTNLVKKENVDAIWVPVDNKLVNKKLLMNAWIPFEKKYKMPIIVGVGSLVNPKFHFGILGVLPDHVALGSQAASVIYDIMDNGWQVDDNGGTQPPLSVYTILNYPDAKAFFGLDKEHLVGVDKILE